MKIKIFKRVHNRIREKEVEDFVKDKKIIDIKMSSSTYNTTDNWGDRLKFDAVDILVMYE